MKSLKFILRPAGTFILVSLLSLTLVSCKKDKDDDSTRKVTVQLSGANEVPAVTTTGNGTAELTYHTDTKVLDYKITWQLGATTSTTVGMHFHGSATSGPGINAGIAIGITGFATGSSGSIQGSTVALTVDQEAQLLSGKWYVNVHSNVNPGGEIRGNISF